MLRNYFTYFLLLFSLIAGQNSNQDSLKLKSPSVAALRAFTFPGGGQFYNNQPIKGSLLTSAGIASIYLYTGIESNSVICLLARLLINDQEPAPDLPQ